MLPDVLVVPLTRHLETVRAEHERVKRRGEGRVELPGGLERKFPGASVEWGWQWVFGAARGHFHGGTGERRRHHLHETVVQEPILISVCESFFCHGKEGQEDDLRTRAAGPAAGGLQTA